MGIYVPVRIQSRDDGSIHGTFPFDSSFEISGSRKKVVHKMYKAAAGYIQNTKCPRFVEMLKEYRQEGLDYLKVDLFSRYEHFLFGLISLAFGVLIFTIFYTFIGYVGLYFTKLGSTPLNSPEIQKEFLEMFRISGWAVLFLFIFLWNIYWTLFYPKMMEVYSAVILLNEGVRSLHLSVISGAVNLLQSKPYWYQEGDDDGIE